MSESTRSTTRKDRTLAGALPRAVIHKKILDEAEASPNATINEIATEVSAASADLVERVLEDYGDPAKTSNESDMTENTEVVNPTSGSNQPGHDESTQDTPALDLQALTEKQRQTLRAIAENPSGTQVEIAEKLGVTNATICNRVNEIDGFDWNKRQEFVDGLFDTDAVNSNGGCRDGRVSPDVTSSKDLEREVKDLANHVERLEERFTQRSTSSQAAFADPDLAARVIHTCMTSEQIAEDEKLDVVKAIVSSVDVEKQQAP